MLDKTGVFVLAVSCALAGAGCSRGCGGAQEPASASASAAATSAPSAVPEVREAAAATGWPMEPALRRMPGMAATLLRGTHELTLGDEKKASVSRIERALLAEEEDGGPGPTGAFFTDLANGIHAGKIDAARIAADYAAIDKAMAAMRAKEVTAIAALHDALDAAERQSLTAALRSRRAARERRFPPPGAGAGADWAKARLDHLTRDLSLDVDGGQEQRVAALVSAAAKTDPQNPEFGEARREESRRRFDAILAAFEGNVLDAGALPLSVGDAKSFHEGPERTASFYAQLLPLLKPEQRDKLGEQLLRIASHRGHFADDGPLTGGPEAPAE